MNFTKFFLYQEMKQRYIDMLPKNVLDLVKDEKLPFNELFGNSLRIITPLNDGMIYLIQKHLGQSNKIDLDKWHVIKHIDKAEKNPIKIGKALVKRKSEIEKQMKGLVGDVPNESLYRQLEQEFGEVNKLLQMSNLQQQVKNQKTKLYIVYSRAPVDVIRMSDFDWHSCHSSDGEFFKCAVADAMLNAGIAYLVSAEDVELVNKHLNDEELFQDTNRNTGQPVRPLARIRLRAVSDSRGKIIAVPSTKIYAKIEEHKYNNDFKEQVVEWAKTQDVSEFKWDELIELQGGSYEDGGYTVRDEIKKIWGKTVKYDAFSHNRDAEESLEEMHPDEFAEHDDDAVDEERILDEFRDDIDDDEILEKLGVDEKLYSVDFDKFGGMTTMTLYVESKVWKILLKNADRLEVQEKIEDLKLPVEFSNIGNLEIKLGRFDLIDYMMGEEYHKDGLYTDVVEKIHEIFKKIIGRQVIFSTEDDYAYASLINAILEKIGMDTKLDLGDNAEWFVENYAYPQYQALYDKNLPDDMQDFNLSEAARLSNRKSVGSSPDLSLQDEKTISMFRDLCTRAELIKSKIKRYISEKYDIKNLNDNDLETRIYSPFIGQEIVLEPYHNVAVKARVRMKSTRGDISKLVIAYTCNKHDLMEIAATDSLDKLGDALESFEQNYVDFSDIDSILAEWGKRLYFNPDQQELDLSSVNRSMTKFDEYIITLTEGLLDSMGTGGNSAGGVKPTGVKSGVVGGNQPVVGSGVHQSQTMKHSGAAVANNGVAATPQAGGIKGNQQMADQIIGMHQTDPNGFQQQLTSLVGTDPDTFNLILNKLVPGK